MRCVENHDKIIIMAFRALPKSGLCSASLWRTVCYSLDNNTNENLQTRARHNRDCSKLHKETEAVMGASP